MTRKFPRLPNYRRTLAVGAVVLLCAGVTAGAPPDTPPPEPVPERLTLDAAVNWALRYNPQLAAQRQQHGIAAAQVVIADTYPFNPVMENRVQQASGPFSATITNFVPFEDVLLWEIELRGQRGYRRQSAAAGLSRTDWQIAFQEQLTTVAVLRAFTTLLYRQEKLRLAEETLRFNEELVERLQKLVTAGKLTGADLLVART